MGGLAGCTGYRAPGGPVVVRSADGTARLDTTLPTGVYAPIDEQSADIYLTDLPLARLADPNDRLRDVTGMVVHIHMFLVPRAGKTPVDATASNAAVRVFVLAEGAVGVFGGGGFLMPSGTPGDETLSGSIGEASLRLLRRTPDFADRLGPSILAGGIGAKLDEEASRVLAGRVQEWLRTTQAVASAPKPTVLTKPE
jgi:hypothetical protein